MSKVVVCSDIHGDEVALEGVFEFVRQRGVDLVLCAGDVGLENPMVGHLLRNRPCGFVCVRGNCDSPFDFVEADLPVAPMCRSLKVNGRDVFLQHGHVDLLDFALGEGSIVISGHTHVGSLQKVNGLYYLNPGSVSRPRGRSERSIALIEEKSISLLRMEDFGVISCLALRDNGPKVLQN